MKIERAFTAFFGIVGLTLSAGCVGEVGEGDGIAGEDVGETEQALSTPFKGQSGSSLGLCWGNVSPALQTCGSTNSAYVVSDSNTIGATTYYKFYKSNAQGGLLGTCLEYIPNTNSYAWNTCGDLNVKPTQWWSIPATSTINGAIAYQLKNVGTPNTCMTTLNNGLGATFCATGTIPTSQFWLALQ